MESVELVRHAVNYDPETGIFTWLNPKSGTRAKVGEVAGSKKSDGYVRLSIYGQEFLAHRAAWMHFYGKVPENMVDHINGDKSDNRICNLRIADLSENNWNRRGKKSICGASQHKRTGLWTALIRHRGKRIYLGLFKTEEEAGKAYQTAAKQLRGEYHE